MNKIDGGVYTKKVMAGQIPLFMWGERFPLATWWLRNRYHSESIIGRPNQVQNFMHYSNSQVDKLIEVAEVSFDEEERNKAVAEAQRLIIKDLVAIPVVETRIPAVRVGKREISFCSCTAPAINRRISGTRSNFIKQRPNVIRATAC